jgi:hypothetical protein
LGGSVDENIHSFAIATDLPEEIAREAEHFKIKIPESVKRGAKWRSLVHFQQFALRGFDLGQI